MVIDQGIAQDQSTDLCDYEINLFLDGIIWFVIWMTLTGISCFGIVLLGFDHDSANYDILI